MKARLVAIAEGWRKDWQRTRETTKVLLILIAMLVLAWVAFATWFWIGFEF
ncbi:MAG: hypothetical protein LC808_20780 [Actinobacteria bacterium]|nr:hypothetical protein [Actinomycetota bacterium]